MSVSFSGIQSGLNTDQIIQQLLQIERQSQLRYQKDKKQASETQNAFQDLNNRIDSLGSKINTLTDSSTFNQKAISNTKPDVLTASIVNQDKAQPGTFDVFVEQMATTAKVSSGQGIHDQNMVANGSPSGSATLVSDFEMVEGSGTLDLTGTTSTSAMLAQLSKEVQTSGNTDPEFTLDLNDDGTREVGVDLDAHSNFQQVINTINQAASNEPGDGTGKDIDGDGNKEAFQFEYDKSRDKFIMTPLQQDGNGGASLDADDNQSVLSDNSKGFLQQIGFNEDDTIHSYDTQESAIDGNVRSIDSSLNLQDNVFTTSLQNPSSTNTIQVNNTKINMDPTSESIGDFVSKVNDKVDGVSATFNSATDKIVIQTENNGAGSVSVSDVSGNLADVLNLRTDGTASGNQAAGVQDNGTDAEVTIDGNKVTADGNTVTFNGIQLDLKQLHKQTNNSGDPVELEISKDEAAIASKVQDFVDQFNSIMEFINKRNDSNPASTPDEQRGESGPFHSDSTIRSIKNKLVEIVTDRFKDATGSDSIQDAASVGIEQVDPLASADQDLNKLEFDQSKFKSALNNAPSEVQDLFSADTAAGDPADGIATELKDYVNNTVTDSVDGILPSRIDGFDRKIENLNDRIERNERRVQRKRERLESKFLQMEQMLTRLNGQQQFVNARL